MTTTHFSPPVGLAGRQRLFPLAILTCIFGCAESGKNGSGGYAQEDVPGRYTDETGEVIRCSTLTSYN